MSQQLTNFLSQLATDNDLVDAFKNDKAGTMKQHDISDEHIDLVVNKKYDEIQNILGANYSIANNDIIKAYKN
jgi:hypothetical protein